jgi:adenosylmethionine-8-amino-7-oxononanoate aminotransferase
MGDNFNLILHRTSKEQLRKGITTIAKGDGVYVFDQNGNRYLDLVSGVTRPVHVGYGRKEIAQTVYDQICELSYFSLCNLRIPRQ